MSDGASVYECTSADEVIDLVQGGQGVFGIAVGRVWREVENNLAEFPVERVTDEEAPAVPGDEMAQRRAARQTGCTHPAKQTTRHARWRVVFYVPALHG